MLLNITGGPDLTLYEVSEIAEYVTQAASPDASIIFGHVVHPRPEVEVRVTLIATGMPDQTAPAPAHGPLRLPTAAGAPLRTAPGPLRGTPGTSPAGPRPPHLRRRPGPRAASETDNLDVPPFSCAGLDRGGRSCSALPPLPGGEGHFCSAGRGPLLALRPPCAPRGAGPARPYPGGEERARPG